MTGDRTEFRTPYSGANKSMRQSIESDRDQNLPLEACIGELLDNSFEWNAKNVWIDYKSETLSGYGKAKKLIICDDGSGMGRTKLADHLTVGFHEAEGGDQASSISKYGVGAKYAFFNTCRKCEVWSKEKGGTWHKAEFDFDDKALDKTVIESILEFQEGKGNGYPRPAIKQNPPVYYSKIWSSLESGTFIQWSKFDKTSASVSGEEQLIWWLESAFRNYIGKEIVSIASENSDGTEIGDKEVKINPDRRNIFFNGTKLKAYDTLYQIPYRDEDNAYDSLGMEVPEPIIMHYPINDTVWVERLGKRKAEIKIFFGIAPRRWRMKSGNPWPKNEYSASSPVNINERRIQGGSATSYSWWDSRKFISITRNGREVGKLADYNLTNKRRDDTDRWLAVTIEFGPELDDVFNVRNIKYQCEPDKDLKKEIKEEIKSTIATMHGEITGWNKKTSADEDARIAEELRKEGGDSSENGPSGRIKTPQSPSEDFANNPANSAHLGDLPDTDENPRDLMQRIFGNLSGFNADEELDWSRKRLTIKPDLQRQIPKDGETMFEYSAQGGKVLKVKFQNHPYYNGLQERYNALMKIGEKMDEELKKEVLDVEVIKRQLDIITVNVKQLEEIRDFGMNAAVLALARQNPKGNTKTYRDIFLREWGQICRVMIQEHFEIDEE